MRIMAKEKVYLALRYIFIVCFIFFIVEGILLSRELHLNFSYLIQIVLLFAVSFLYLWAAYIKKNRNTKWIDFIKYIVHFSAMEVVLMLFLIYNLLWIIVIPYFNGISITNSISEAGMIVMLFLFFPIERLLMLGEISLKRYLKIGIVSILVLNVLTSVTWIVENIMPGTYVTVLNVLDRLPIDIFSINEVLEGWGIIRIVQSNLVWIPVYLFVIISTCQKFKWYHYIFSFITTFAVLTSYLKSLWLGVGFGMLIVIIFFLINRKNKKSRIELIKMVVFLLLSVIILDTVVFGGTIKNRIVNAFGFTAQESVDTSETGDGSESIYESDSFADLKDIEKEANEKKEEEGSKESILIRVEQIQLLVDKWKESPVFGFGYGAYIKGYTRDARIPNYFIFETTFFALLMKLGVFGILVWGATFVFVIVQAWKKIDRAKFAAWAAVLGCFAVTIQTNPLLFNTNSVFLILSLLLCIYEKVKEPNKV